MKLISEADWKPHPLPAQGFYLTFCFVGTPNTRVLPMQTIVYSEWIVFAVPYILLRPSALDIVKNDWSCSLSEGSISWSVGRSGVAEHPAHHCRVIQVPGVVAHSPPGLLVEDFNASLRIAAAAD